MARINWRQIDKNHWELPTFLGTYKVRGGEWADPYPCGYCMWVTAPDGTDLGPSVYELAHTLDACLGIIVRHLVENCDNPQLLEGPKTMETSRGLSGPTELRAVDSDNGGERGRCDRQGEGYGGR